MEYSLRNLAMGVLAAAVATAGTLEAQGQGSGLGVQGQGNASRAPAPDSRPPTPDALPAAPEPTGQSLMAEAARRIAAEPRVSADLRYRVNAFGQELLGTGRYLQLAAGAETLVRFELRVQLGDQSAVVQEIRGPGTFWIRRDVPPAPPTLGRVDLRQLRRSLSAAAMPPARGAVPQEDWILFGGLTRLMAALEQNFDFAAPRAAELPFNSTDGKSIVRLPIWRVEGKWKPSLLKSLVGREPKRGEPLPEQLPDRVELILGRSEDNLALFPYRIAYWKTPPARAGFPGEAPESGEFLTLELFNVSRRPIDEREFDYQPGDQRVEELTPLYAQRLSGDTKPR